VSPLSPITLSNHSSIKQHVMANCWDDWTLTHMHCTVIA
jgi:hypothetical protein